VTYQTFQMLRSKMRDIELRERAADIASPRPPLNNSIQDQMMRDLYDRVQALEAAQPQPKAVVAPPVRPFSLPNEKA
jgi:hypothetical protein